jgi:hypothetical protein
MVDDPKKCAVLIPVHYTIDPDCEDALRELSSRGYPVIVLRGSSAIDMARNDLANGALDKGYEELFWIDSDVVFNPDDVDKIRSRNLPFVCGLYPKKGRREFACKFWPSTERELVFGVGGGLLKVQYTGMGFTHIRAEVFRKVERDLQLPMVKGGYTVAKRIVPYFLPMLAPDLDGEEGELVYLAEDASFCERARQVGYDVVADTTIRLDHMGMRKWCWEDFAPQKVYDSLKFSTVEDDAQPEKKETMSDKLYADLGRKQERIEQLDAAFDQLLRITAQLLSGEIEPSRVMIDLTNRAWIVAPMGQSPPMPATINGLPNCVVAKPKEKTEPMNGVNRVAEALDPK